MTHRNVRDNSRNDEGHHHGCAASLNDARGEKKREIR